MPSNLSFHRKMTHPLQHTLSYLSLSIYLSCVCPSSIIIHVHIYGSITYPSSIHHLSACLFFIHPSTYICMHLRTYHLGLHLSADLSITYLFISRVSFPAHFREAFLTCPPHSRVMGQEPLWCLISLSFFVVLATVRTYTVVGGTLCFISPSPNQSQVL